MTGIIGCPQCSHREWVSDDDPDASLSEMVSHFLSRQSRVRERWHAINPNHKRGAP